LIYHKSIRKRINKLLIKKKKKVMEEKLTTYDMPETTTAEVIDKIAAYAKEIKFNPTFPGGECRAIVILTEKLKEILK